MLLSGPAGSWGRELALESSAEVGETSTADDFLEEDDDRDYLYNNYRLGVDQKLSDNLKFDLNASRMDKDYKTADALDNLSQAVKTGWNYRPAWDPGKPLTLDLDLQYRQKLYPLSPKSEFDQFSIEPALSYRFQDRVALKCSGGLDRADYREGSGKDQWRYFGKFSARSGFGEHGRKVPPPSVYGKAAEDQKWTLTNAYRLESLDRSQAGRQRTKQEVSAGVSHQADLKWLSGLSASGRWGQADTKLEDQRDEDLDYEYWRANARTEHPMGKKLSASLKYEYFKKSYFTGDLNHRGFLVRNGWNWNALERVKRRVKCGLDFEHKEVRYFLKQGKDYRKETFSATVDYSRDKVWNASLALEQNIYSFNDRRNDKSRTAASLSVSRTFWDESLKAVLDLKHRFTDFEGAEDKTQEAARLSLQYRY